MVEITPGTFTTNSPLLPDNSGITFRLNCPEQIAFGSDYFPMTFPLQLSVHDTSLWTFTSTTWQFRDNFPVELSQSNLLSGPTISRWTFPTHGYTSLLIIPINLPLLPDNYRLNFHREFFIWYSPSIITHFPYIFQLIHNISSNTKCFRTTENNPLFDILDWYSTAISGHLPQNGIEMNSIILIYNNNDKHTTNTRLNEL